MTTFGMVIDISRCTGCYNCFLACRDEHAGNDHRPIAAPQPDSGHRWIDVQEHERGKFPRVRVDYVPLPCQQCKDAPCLSRAPEGTLYRRADGIVVIDPEKAKGHPEIVLSCPYRAIYWNPAENVAQKCTFCAHLLDQGWKEPRCVEACPTEALVFGDLDDPASKIAQLIKAKGAEELHPEFGVKPSVHYIGLPKRFVSGELAFADRMDEAAAGVRVSLRNGAKAQDVTSDAYGDFSFDGLEPGVAYVLHVAVPGYRPRTVEIGTRSDVDLGTIVLERA